MKCQRCGKELKNSARCSFCGFEENVREMSNAEKNFYEGVTIDVDSNGKNYHRNTNSDYYLLVNDDVKFLPQVIESMILSLEKKDMDAAFEEAHALKGVLGNLSLSPLFDTISEITELLRSKTETDYEPLLTKLLEEKDALSEIIG